MTRLTESREACLATVAEGNVRYYAPITGKAYYTVIPYWQKPRQAPYVWLFENLYIKHGVRTATGAAVTLTKKGANYDGTNA